MSWRLSRTPADEIDTSRSRNIWRAHAQSHARPLRGFGSTRGMSSSMESVGHEARVLRSDANACTAFTQIDNDAPAFFSR